MRTPIDQIIPVGRLNFNELEMNFTFPSSEIEIRFTRAFNVDAPRKMISQGESFRCSLKHPVRRRDEDTRSNLQSYLVVMFVHAQTRAETSPRRSESSIP